MQKYTIRCNEDQLKLISFACDIVSRLQMCQFDRVADLIEPSSLVEDPDFKKLHAFQDDLLNLKAYFNLSQNMYHGIFSEKVPDSARTWWDIHQVIRNRLAYDSNPSVTPENRWEKRKFTVDFDEPFHADEKNELIRVEKI